MKKGQIDEAFRDNQNGHQQFWKRIAELIKPDKSNTSADFLHHESGERVASEQAADYFNEYFATVGEKMSRKMNYDINTHRDINYVVAEECQPCVIEEDKVLKLVQGIKTNKSSGIDGINARQGAS